MSVWFSEKPLKGKKFSPVNTGGCYLCELCEDLEDFSKCDGCNGEGSFYIEVRHPIWKSDVVDHLSERKASGAVELPVSFWKIDTKELGLAAAKGAKNFGANCGGSLGTSANFCASCGAKT